MLAALFCVVVLFARLLCYARLLCFAEPVGQPWVNTMVCGNSVGDVVRGRAEGLLTAQQVNTGPCWWSFAACVASCWLLLLVVVPRQF